MQNATLSGIPAARIAATPRTLCFGMADLVPLRDDLTFVDTLEDCEREAFFRIKNHARQLSRMGGRVAAYAALRKLFRCETRSWIILNDHNGAPFLPGFPEVRISLTHSPRYAVAAVGVTAAGIDLERIEKRPDSLRRYFFSESEQYWMCSNGAASVNTRLHILWTRKEAICKLRGDGGRLPFKTIAALDAESEYILKSRIIGDHVISIARFPDEISTYE